MNETEFMELLEDTTEIFKKEPNILKIKYPVTILGDIHGEFEDLLEAFRITPPVPEQKVLLLGDYVDRGYESIECLIYLLELKVKYPNQIFLLRGNHECREITEAYGFFDECIRKFSKQMYEKIMACFDTLPLAAVIQDEFFAVHAGISPSLMFLSDIEKINRFEEIPQEGGLMSDIVWSDPTPTGKYDISARGCGYSYGPEAVDEFCENTGLKYIIRGHQMMENGYSICCSGRVITVFSAPNYAFRTGNYGALMEIMENGEFLLKSFRQRAVCHGIPEQGVDYFL